MYGPLGSLPLGSFPIADSLAVADPLPNLLNDPAAVREFLLRANPRLKLGNYCLQFDIDDDGYVSYGDVFNKDKGSDFTAEIHFNSDTVGTSRVLCCKINDVATDAGWAIYYSADIITGLISDGSQTKTVFVDGTDYLDGYTHIVSMVVNRVTSELLLYVDGVLVDSNTTTGVDDLTNSDALMVGNHGALTLPFEGQLDDFRLWPTARTLEEINDTAFRELTAAEYALCDIYAQFNEGTGLTTDDLGSSAITATIFGATWTTSVGPINVDLSSGGYVSATDDVPYKLFPGAIITPYNFSSALALPDLIGGSSVNVSDIRLSNPDALLDPLTKHDWLGCDCDMYIGRRYDSLTEFTRFFKAFIAGPPTKRLDSLNVPSRDLRFRLQRRLQQHIYMGTGACVRTDGVNDYVSATHTCPAGSMTMEALIRSRQSVASVGMSFRNGASVAGVRSIQPSTGAGFSNSAGNCRFVVRNDANTAFEVMAGAGELTSNQLKRVSCVLDVSALQIRIYIDGVLKGTTSVTGTFNTVLSNLELGRDGGSASQFFTGDIDDVRVWSIALTRAQINKYMHRELLGTETGLSYYNKLNEGSGTTATATVGTAMTLQNGATWVGSLEGDESIAGRVKPVRIGECYQVSLIPVDPQRLVYQVNDGSIESVLAVRDMCDLVATNVGDNADIYATSPTTAQYSTSLANGLIRFGYSPQGTPTADIEGDNGGALGYTTTAADCHRKIVTQFGGLSDPGDLDVASYSRLNALSSATIQLSFTDEINCDVAADQAVAGIMAWASPNRLQQSAVGRIDPPETLTPTIDITDDDIIDPQRGGSYEGTVVGVRLKAVRVGYLRYHEVFSPEQIFGGASITERTDFSTEYRFVTAGDFEGVADADRATYYTAIVDRDAAQAEADRLLELKKVDRFTKTLVLDEGLLSHFIGTVFRETYERYDTTEAAGGKIYVAYGIDESMGSYGESDKLGVRLFG